MSHGEKIPKRYRVKYDKEICAYDLYFWYQGKYCYSGSYSSTEDAKMAAVHILGWYACSYEHDWNNFIERILF